MNIQATFHAPSLPFYFIAHRDGRKTLEVQAFDDILTVSVQYDFDRRPLNLNAQIHAGDKVEVVMRPHRIELHVNGTLMDEEWPMGERLFAIGDQFMPDAPIQLQAIDDKEKEEPCIVSTFENAEGWCPGGGVFVGDCMPHCKNGTYHVLYLKDRHHHGSSWGLGAHQWAHISTTDFKTWNVHPLAVPITDPAEGSICTGSRIEKDGREYLFYAVRQKRGLPALICRSVSDDGYHFTKDKDFSFTLAEKYSQGHARDPKVVKGDDGLYHMFMTTLLMEEQKGCLAHYVSEDLDHWRVLDEPIYVAPDIDQPECPDHFMYKGKYYLVFSLHGQAHYMISDKPFSDFVMPTDPIIPCASVPKCAEWNGRLIFTGFKARRVYAGTMTFKAAVADETGRLIFEDL